MCTPWNRARRPAQFVRRSRARVGERNRRTVETVLQSPGDDADDALMPAFPIDAQTELRLAGQIDRSPPRVPLPASSAAGSPSRLVEFLERRRQRARLDEIVGEQATDADAHVVEPTGGVEARSERRTRGPAADNVAMRPARGFAQRANSRSRLAGVNAAQTLLHQDAVVVIERHDVGDRAERRRGRGSPPCSVRSMPMRSNQPRSRSSRAQQREHIEDDADTGEIRAAEPATGQIRIDDRVRVGHFAPGQMMIRDDRRSRRRRGPRARLRRSRCRCRPSPVRRDDRPSRSRRSPASAHSRIRTGSAR